MHVHRPILLTDAGVLAVGGAGAHGDSLASAWEHAIRVAGGAPLNERTSVLAIGSNAAAATLRRKMSRRRASRVVPLLPAVVVGIGAAHSAHVSLGGYIAAAPYAARSAATHAALGLFDSDQLCALDDSEPNYQRISISPSRYPVCVVGYPLPPPVSYQLYRSVWGVLAHRGHVVTLRGQAAMHGLVRADPVLRQVVPLREPSAAVRSLSQPRVQALVRDHWRRTGAAVPDGLTG